jgi:hypothetical protein
MAPGALVNVLPKVVNLKVLRSCSFRLVLQVLVGSAPDPGKWMLPRNSQDSDAPRSRLLTWMMAVGGTLGLVASWLFEWWV